MTDRRYDDEEVSAIFLAAAEGPQATSLSVPRSEGLTLADLQEIGREVGIAPEAVAQAAQGLELRGRGASRILLGLPIGVERTVALDRRLTDEEWEQLVVELREVFKARGTVTSYGSLRQWTNGNLHALLEPTPTGHRLRLGTLNGSARSSMIAGLASVGIAGAVATAVAAGGGDLVGAAPGIGFLLVMGLGMFANGALRLPSWARLRGRQMEAISARLALFAGSAPPPSTPGTTE
jgi:hypothetical protein